MPFNHPVPSLKYATFLDAFEQMVAQKQKEINDMRQMEQVYSICSNALNYSEIKIPVKLDWGPGWIQLVSNLTKDTGIGTYQFLREVITTRLFETGLCETDKTPNVYYGGYYVYSTWRIKKKGDRRAIEITLKLEIPYYPPGSKYINVTKREEMIRHTIPTFYCTEPGYEHEWN